MHWVVDCDLNMIFTEVIGGMLNCFLKLYEVHSTIIFPGSGGSDFAGNSRAQELNKAQTKRANKTDVQYNSQISTGIGVNFMLSLLLIYICANSHILSLSIVSASHRCCRSLPLTCCVRYDVQYTVAATAIPRPILWACRFFIVHSFTWDWDWAIGFAVFVPLSRTSLKFSRPICLRLFSRLCRCRTLVVPLLLCHNNLPQSPSSGISFVVPNFLPLCHISAAISITC